MLIVLAIYVLSKPWGPKTALKNKKNYCTPLIPLKSYGSFYGMMGQIILHIIHSLLSNMRKFHGLSIVYNKN